MAERIGVGEVELAYERSGDGPPVVFVHGLGGRKEAWTDVRSYAAEAGFDTIAIDLRGAGESDTPPGPYSVEGWANDLIGLIDGLGLSELSLVGHSVGCMVVEHAALALQDNCRALAMLGGALAWGEGFGAVLTERAELARAGRMREIAEAVALTGLTEASRRDAGLLDRFIAMFETNDPDGYAESCLATARGAMVQPDGVRAPALAFAGAEDAVTPLSGAEEIAAAVPRGEVETVPEGAHWCHMEVPGAVSECLLGFLARFAIG
jgi:pimeloyl-ACP methyl ester carboxylesterase